MNRSGKFIDEADSACSLNEFLRAKVPEFLGREISNSKIRRLLVSGAVRVNSVQRRIPSFCLKRGDKVEAFIDEARLTAERQTDDIEFELDGRNVLFEDEHIIVANKPAFLPTEASFVRDRKNMHQAVVDYLRKKNPELKNPPYAGIMHRLDRGTSGAILFTKARGANAAAHALFDSEGGRSARKLYRAVCKPNSKNKNFSVPDEFFAENFIGRTSGKSASCKMGLLPPERGGKFARTEFVVASRSGGLFYIDCRLCTGRTHQIRVHLAQKGLPVLGDSLYGGAEAGRVMLHAHILAFAHPVTGEFLEIEAPLPEGFAPQESQR